MPWAARSSRSVVLIAIAHAPSPLPLSQRERRDHLHHAAIRHNRRQAPTLRFPLTPWERGLGGEVSPARAWPQRARAKASRISRLQAGHAAPGDLRWREIVADGNLRRGSRRDGVLALADKVVGRARRQRLNRQAGVG